MAQPSSVHAMETVTTSQQKTQRANLGSKRLMICKHPSQKEMAAHKGSAGGATVEASLEDNAVLLERLEHDGFLMYDGNMKPHERCKARTMGWVDADRKVLAKARDPKAGLAAKMEASNPFSALAQQKAVLSFLSGSW
eukprot:gene10458-1897_t